jgi:multidrug efflux pump
VVLVVILFLQTWRASIIPLLAVPVSIVGTFALMLAFGFSINALSLFGLVLAIGIVVDDAIVVVENVERNIEEGLSPRRPPTRPCAKCRADHRHRAGAVAVFVPLAFMTGLTGQFYKQFALTIAISTVISAFNSLTLSPALAALLLKGHDADWLTRGMDRVLGGFFRASTASSRSSSATAAACGRDRARPRCSASTRCCWWRPGVPDGARRLRAGAGQAVPGGFAQLPDGATLDRTEDVIRRMSRSRSSSRAWSAVAFPGLSINGFTNSPTPASCSSRSSRSTSARPELSAGAIAGAEPAVRAIQDAFIAVFPPPPVQGLGTIGGFKLQIEDRAALGYDALDKRPRPSWPRPRHARAGRMFTSYQVNVPQLDADSTAPRPSSSACR